MDLKNAKNINLEVHLINPLGIVNLEDLTYLYKDTEAHRITKDVSLYFILQRPCILFKKLEISLDTITGIIHQPYTTSQVEFELPLLQKDVIEGENRPLQFGFAVNKYYGKEINSTAEVLKEHDNIEMITISESMENGNAFIKLLTPDLILERFYSSMWNLNIIGNLEKLLTFEVAYIGHSVKQDILVRLKNHHAIQKLLSVRRPFQKGMHISKELNICLFKIKDIYDSKLLNNLEQEEFLNFVRGQGTPTDDNIYYDVEKAYIKFFNNDDLEKEEKYHNYPKSVNGLYDKNYPTIAYKITDPYILYSGQNIISNNNYLIVNKNEESIEKI